RGSPCRLRIYPAEIERTEIKLLDKHVNYTNRVVLVDPVIQAFGKQCRLPAVHSLDKALHRDLPPKIASQFYHVGGFHTAWVERGPPSRVPSVRFDSHHLFCEDCRVVGRIGEDGLEAIPWTQLWTQTP